MSSKCVNTQTSLASLISSKTRTTTILCWNTCKAKTFSTISNLGASSSPNRGSKNWHTKLELLSNICTTTELYIEISSWRTSWWPIIRRQVFQSLLTSVLQRWLDQMSRPMSLSELLDTWHQRFSERNHILSHVIFGVLDALSTPFFQDLSHLITSHKRKLSKWLSTINWNSTFQFGRKCQSLAKTWSQSCSRKIQPKEYH